MTVDLSSTCRPMTAQLNLQPLTTWEPQRALQRSTYCGMFRLLRRRPWPDLWGSFLVVRSTVIITKIIVTYVPLFDLLFLASQFTMPKFITHEPLANNLFNVNHCTGTGPLQPWATALTNNDEILTLMVQRMEADYLALGVKMRKPWGKDVEPRPKLVHIEWCLFYKNVGVVILLNI